MSSRLLRWFVAAPEEAEGGSTPRSAAHAAGVDVVPSRSHPRRASLAGSGAAPTARPVFAPPRAAVTTAAAPSAATGASDDGDVVVLGPPSDIEVIAGGAAATLRRRGSPSIACVWAPGEDHGPVSPPSFPAAGRWARRLRAHGLTATAVGAVARVRLADDPTRALREVGRVQAVAGGPVVLALTRRDPVLDALLAGATWVGVLPLRDATMTSLVVEQASALNGRTIVLDRPASPALRIGHLLGLRALALAPRAVGATEHRIEVTR